MLKADVNEAIKRWRANATYLTFIKADNSADEEEGMARFISRDCGGCYSAVGFSFSPIIALQKTCRGSTDVFYPLETAVHEIGHLLGTFTTVGLSSSINQQLKPSRLLPRAPASDRETFISVKCSAVPPECPEGITVPAGKTCCELADVSKGCCGMMTGPLSIIESEGTDFSGPYDPSSIRHCQLPGILDAKPGGPAFPEDVIRHPSSIDTSRLCKIYSYMCPKALECKAAGCPE